MFVQFWVKLGPNWPFARKETFFGRFKCYFCLPMVPNFTKIVTIDHEIQDCLNLGKFESKLTICP